MYLSHTVRRMRDDPIDDERVVLVVTAGETTVADLEKRLESTGGTVTDRLQFGALRVETTEENVAQLCGLDGIDAIETEHTVGVGGDAGEDL